MTQFPDCRVQTDRIGAQVPPDRSEAVQARSQVSIHDEMNAAGPASRLFLVSDPISPYQQYSGGSQVHHESTVLSVSFSLRFGL